MAENVLKEVKKHWPKVEWEGDSVLAKANIGSLWIMVNGSAHDFHEVCMAIEVENGVRHPIWRKNQRDGDLKSLLDDGYKYLLNWLGGALNAGVRLQHVIEPHLFRPKEEAL